MANIANYRRILSEAEACGARLVAVSKQRSVSEIEALYQAGQRDFGENRVQELLLKRQALPDDIRWHFIGRLQRNKVRLIAPFVHLIHSVDSLELALEIDKQALRCGRTIDGLLQFHLAQEPTKSGLDWEEALNLLQSPGFAALEHLRLCGVMTMASLTEDEAQIRSEFARLRTYFEELRRRFFDRDARFSVVSMGMSGDYALALQEGSTLLRIGSSLF